jgi:hypothetical protein
LPAGSYNVHVTRSYDDPATHERRYYRLPAVFYSAPLVLKEGLEPTPVVLQAVPHVTITVQYVDGQGRPTAGLDMSVHAWRSQMEPRFFKVQGTTTWWTLTFAELGQGTWGTSVKPDREGKAIVQVPKGGNVQFTLVTNERRAIKYRSGKDAPAWPAWDGYRIDLGRVDADTPDFLICCYAAPRVVVSVYGQDGRKLSGVKVTGAYRGSTWAYPEGNNQLRFDDLPGEGQYCSRSMLPDEEVTITATADGCAPQKTTVSLYEGEDREIELVLGKP